MPVQLAKRATMASAAPLCLAILMGCASAFAQPVSVKDQRDQTIEFPRAPERIVTIPIPAASTVITVDGETKRLVGMNPSSKAAIQEGPLKDIFPEAAISKEY